MCKHRQSDRQVDMVVDMKNKGKKLREINE